MERSWVRQVFGLRGGSGPGLGSTVANLSFFFLGGGVIWEFPKTRGTILGVPIIRIIVFWGLYWGPFILGNCHFAPSKRRV